MPKLHATIIVHRPIEDVFAFVADQSKLPQWQAGVVGAGLVSDEPMGVGARYATTIELMGRRYETAGVITEYDPPHKYAFQATAGSFPVDGAFLCESSRLGTRVTFDGELKQTGLMRMTARLLGPVMDSQLASNFQKLKEILEAEPGQGA